MTSGCSGRVLRACPMDIEMDARWHQPFSAILTGPNNCGKSYFIKSLFLNANYTLFVMPENSVWFYPCWQPLYEELLRHYTFIKFVEGLPSDLNDDELLPPNKINLIVVDNLMAPSTHKLLLLPWDTLPDLSKKAECSRVPLYHALQDWHLAISFFI